MSMRTIVVVVIVVMAFLGGIVWQSQMQKAQPTAASGGETQSAPAMPGGGDPNAQAGGAPQGQAPAGGQQIAAPPSDASPGLAWDVPSTWTTGEQRPMRLATYAIPAKGGDADGGECAVFYFGPNQGGGAAENLDRWVGQFDHPSQPERSQVEIAGFKVWRVHVKGAYLAPSGPMMQSSGSKPGYALNGAIVEGPAGRVFFKLTGPEKTVAASANDFEKLLKSMRKG